MLSKDTHRPIAKFAAVIKAGTRFEPSPGLTVGLEEFAFKVRISDSYRLSFVAARDSCNISTRANFQLPSPSPLPAEHDPPFSAPYPTRI